MTEENVPEDEQNNSNEDQNKDSEQEAEQSEASLQRESGDDNTLFVEIPAEKYQNLQEKAKEHEELVDKLRQTRADFDNYRKRMKKKREEDKKYAIQKFIRKIVPVLDDFDQAMPDEEEIKDENTALAEGIRMIRKKFLGYLQEEGVSVIDETGVPFDPNRHEASGMIEDESVDQQTVKHIQRTGYTLHDRVIRPAQVLVAQPPSEDE